MVTISSQDTLKALTPQDPRAGLLNDGQPCRSAEPMLRSAHRAEFSTLSSPS